MLDFQFFPLRVWAEFVNERRGVVIDHFSTLNFEIAHLSLWYFTCARKILCSPGTPAYTPVLPHKAHTLC